MPVWGAVLSLLGKGVSPVANVLGTNRRHAEAELGDLRMQLLALLDKVKASSVHAQMAIRGSPNEETAQTAQRNAISTSTEAAQEFACLFPNNTVVPAQPAALIEARRRYREVVADESNLDVVRPDERELRCVEIENACAIFHDEIEKRAYQSWGIGLGTRSGRLKGRQRPK